MLQVTQHPSIGVLVLMRHERVGHAEIVSRASETDDLQQRYLVPANDEAMFLYKEIEYSTKRR